MYKYLEKYVNQLNRYETLFLVVWAAIIIIEKLFSPSIEILIIISSTVLSLYYFLQGRLAFEKMKDKSFWLRSYPTILGQSSAIMALSVYFKIMHYPGASIISYAGMIGVLASSLLLFYTPIQDEYLPIMKKILFRIFMLISVGFMLSL